MQGWKRNIKGVIESTVRVCVRVLIFGVLTILAVYFGGCDGKVGGEDPNEIVLYSSLPTKISSLDPGNIGDVYSATVTGNIFERLYEYHYLKRPYELVPSLASGMPEISDDGLIYKIKIKDGVYFADDPCFEGGKGRELVAEDFIYAWKRIANIKYLSRNWWIFDEKIVGLDEFREYTKSCESKEDVDYSRPVEGLAAPDKYTLLVKLNKPNPQFLYILAHGPSAPVAREAVDYYGMDIISNPVGTGPFILKTWHRGSYIELSRNENYRESYYPSEGEAGDAEKGYLDYAGRRLPIPDRVLLVVIQEDQPRWLMFLRGVLDATSIPKDNFNQALTSSRNLTEEMKHRGIELKSFRDPSTFWIGFNMEDPVVGNNKPLRKAIGYALNRDKYIELFSNNRAEPAYGIIPPLLESYNPAIKEFGIHFDRDKARELLKQAAEINGGELPKLKLSFGGTDTVFRQMGQFYVRNFKDVGLNVEIEYLDWPTYLKKMKTKSLQMFSSGWAADYPDAETFLQLFYSPNASPGPNNFNYSSEEFDKLYEEFAVMPAGPERTKLYRRAEKLIIEDCPAVFTVHRVAYILHHSWTENYKPHVFQYGLSKYRNINVQARRNYDSKLEALK
jgi:ABC-type transport system substrate-binding protein